MKGLKSALCFLAIVGGAAAYGQSDEGIRRSELSLSFNANMVEGVNGLGNSDLGTFGTNWGESPFGGSLTYAYNFSPIAGLWAGGFYGQVAGLNEVEQFSTEAFGFGAGLRLHPLSFTSSFLNGVYVDGGAGYASYTATRHFISDGAMMVPPFTSGALTFQGKLGYETALTANLKLDLGLGLTAVQSDDFDGWAFDGEPADAIFSPSVGLTYVFGEKSTRAMSDMTAMDLINSEMQLDGYATNEDVGKLSKALQRDSKALEDLRNSLSKYVPADQLEGIVLEIMNSTANVTVENSELKGVISIYFDFDSDAIKEEYRDEITEFFKEYNDATNRILLVGYADIYGTQDYNENLKSERVEAVIQMLINDYEIQNNAIKSQIGEIKVSNVAQQYLNRRVDIFVY